MSSRFLEKIPSVSATRIGLLLLVPVAVVLGVNTKLWAADPPKTWTSGETLTAADLNANFAAIRAELEALTAPNPWFMCGTLMGLTTGTRKCELNAYHVEDYEYGLAMNSVEPRVVDCLSWNLGQRVVNRDPYMVDSDNPPAAGAMQRGGFIFYTGTQASDDDIPSACPADRWRHSYWKISGGSVALFNTQGCFDWPIHCRARR